MMNSNDEPRLSCPVAHYKIAVILVTCTMLTYFLAYFQFFPTAIMYVVHISETILKCVAIRQKCQDCPVMWHVAAASIL